MRAIKIDEVRRATDALGAVGVGREAVARMQYERLAEADPKWLTNRTMTEWGKLSAVNTSKDFVSGMLGFPASSLVVLGYSDANQSTDDLFDMAFGNPIEQRPAQAFTEINYSGRKTGLSVWARPELGIAKLVLTTYSSGTTSGKVTTYYVAYRGK